MLRYGWVVALLTVASLMGRPTLGSNEGVSALPGGDGPAPKGEKHRILIDNTSGGAIQGSRDGGKTWVLLGRILRPLQGGIWLPTVTNGVTAFNFLRGPSNVFATAVNAVHLRFSDPAGYELPADPATPLIPPHGASLLPKDTVTDSGSVGDFVAITDIPAGTGIFGPEWSPKVGSQLFMGDGQSFGPIPYEYGPDSRILARSKILIIVEEAEHEIEWVQFENRVGGRVIVKRKDVADESVVAKVLQPVLGVGRFVGSDFVARPGVLRANHAGVFCIGTTDRNSDPASIPPGVDINEQRGGFQVVPSHHYQDPSLRNGGGHGFVYMVVGPLQDPPNLVRYDRGIDGQFPLFRHGFQAGGGTTRLKFQGDDAWYEMGVALKAGKFRRQDGSVVEHLRGVIPDALSQVTDIRFETGY